MKISEVTVNDLKEYMHVDYEDDDKVLNIILSSVKSYILSYTGLDVSKVDNYEDITMALYVLCNEMYENKLYSVQSDKINPLVKSMLDMHSINLL